MPRTQHAVAALTLAAMIPLAGCGDGPENDLPASEVMPRTEIFAGSTVETAGLPVVLDLGSDTCAACRTMAPILDDLAEEFEGRMDVRFVDVREERSAASEFGVKIIPTQIFFDEEGRELFRHQGFYSRDDILAKWAELGHTFGGSPGDI